MLACCPLRAGEGVMTEGVDGRTTTCGTMEITLHPESRLVALRFVAATSLTGEHGVALVDAMKSVIDGSERFALIADVKGAYATDADYRAATGNFFRQHRDAARIALFNLGPILRVVTEMFRVGIGLQLKTFADEAAARSWLRKEGIRA
jgi:hypothetical protein